MTAGTSARGGNGRFTRTAASIRRDHEAAELRGQGLSYAAIAARLKFSHKGKAHEAVMRAFADIPSEESAQAKKLDLERIDRLIEWNWATMLREHVTVSHGKVVGRQAGWQRDDDGQIMYDGDGAPIPLYEDVPDDGPGQASAREIRMLLERRAKMFGYDAPVRHEVRTIGEIDARLLELADEVAGVDAGDPPGVPVPS